jgi:hypothetical protein
MDGFDAYLGGWSFRIYSSGDATTVALQEAVAKPDLALAYAAGVVDAVARASAKTRAAVSAALAPLLLHQPPQQVRAPGLREPLRGSLRVGLALAAVLLPIEALCLGCSRRHHRANTSWLSLRAAISQ